MIKKVLIVALLVFSSIVIAQESGGGDNSAYKTYLVDFNKVGEKNDDWKVRLNSSADFSLNRVLSYTKNVRVENTAEPGLFRSGASGNVLGIRVNYPHMPVNAFAEVTPPEKVNYFETDKYNEKGLLTNVGIIRSIKAFVKGKNYPHSMYLNLRNERGEKNSYFLGYLNFSGWKEKTYENPNYLNDTKFIDLEKITPSPGYPNAEPYVALESISFFKHGGNITGDFITYIGWIQMEYDQGVVKIEDDIDDENVWQIQTDEYNRQSEIERRRLERSREILEIEKIKKNLRTGSATSSGSAETETETEAEAN